MADITHGTWIKDGKAVDAVYQGDVKVYGRNLLTGTANKIITGQNAYGYLSNETNDDFLSLFQGLEGETVTISVDYKYQGFVAGTDKNRIGWESRIVADSKTLYFGPWYYADSSMNSSGSGRIFSTFVVPKNITSIGYANGYIQFSGSGIGTLSHLKLEKGSVATDWSPAPEDILN